MADRTGRHLWQEAETLAELGELTAQWLEGRITFIPANFADAPSPETAELVPRLAAYNRTGFVTTDSQPGIPLGGEWAQRAFVCGFADDTAIDAIEEAFLGTRLVALATPPASNNVLKILVTMLGGTPCTWLGEPLAPLDLIDHYEQDVPEAVETLLNTWQLEAFDPEWGNNDLLWARLDQALKA